MIIDSETMKYETIKKPAMDAGKGAGIAVAQSVARQGVGTLLTGFVGPKAYSGLQAAGIQIFDGLNTMDVWTALKQHTDRLLLQCSGVNARKGIPDRGHS